MTDLPRNFEHPWLTHAVLEAAAAYDTGRLERVEFGLSDEHCPSFGEWAFANLAMPRGVAESFAWHLSRAVGVRVAPVVLTHGEPPAFGDYVKRVEGGWATSQRVPESLPLYYLSEQCQTLQPEPESHAHDSEVSGDFHEVFYSLLDKRCPVGRDSYPDFPTQAPETALRSATWNSPARILTHAFRAFLYCSYAHSSNTLVDVAGRLWLIDHEKIAHRGDADDVLQLHEYVNKSRAVMKACARVGQIKEIDIRRALSGFRARYWRDKETGKPHAILPDCDAATDYFTSRLTAWRKCFVAQGARVYSGSYAAAA